MGAVVFPPLPAFYHRPGSIAEMIDHSCARVLALFGLQVDGKPEWPGMRAPNRET
jgi:4-hydroxy-3-polyprenylbenzoate decarboxylase